MFSNQTPNYGLPQWQNEDTPTWLGDMNEAFANIDENLKRVEDKAEEGGVPQSIIDRIVALENNVTQILAKIGTDVIDTIGTSITNAIVNLKSAIDTITTKIGTDVIDTIGTSITNAIVNLKSAIDSAIENITTNTNNITQILTKIGDESIVAVGSSITNAIKNLSNTLSSHTQILYDLGIKIGTDVIDTIGTSITNAIVNLKSAIDTATTNITTINELLGEDLRRNLQQLHHSSLDYLIGNDELDDTSITKELKNIWNEIFNPYGTFRQLIAKIGNDAIDTIGTSITNAIVNLKSAIDSAIENITTNANNITQILAKIGSDSIDLVGTSITNAILALYNTITGIQAEIENIVAKIGDTDISAIGTSITNAIVNLNDKYEKKIYQHTISLRGGNGYNKFEITLLRNNDTPLNALQLTQLIKDKCSIYDSTSSVYVSGLPITGVIKPESASQSFQAIAIFYSLDANKLCVKYLNTSISTAYQQEYIDEITIPSAPSLYSIIEII